MSSYAYKLSEEEIPQAPSLFQREEGAEVRFLGTVRETEQGEAIRGIEYTVFESMALKELEKLCLAMQAEAPEHRVFIQHRLGFVAAREPSILIVVHTKHSAEGFDLCREYLKRIKTSVPIWKKALT